MPTDLERSGDFSRTTDAAGRPVIIYDPLTRLPFANNVIPAARLNQVALKGTWRVSSQSVTPVSSGAAIQLGFQAAKVYLVMTSADNVPRQVTVLLDGRRYSSVTVRGQQLYTLVSLPSDQQHALAVQVPPGVSAYDFTFG